MYSRELTFSFHSNSRRRNVRDISICIFLDCVILNLVIKIMVFFRTKTLSFGCRRRRRRRTRSCHSYVECILTMMERNEWDVVRLTEGYFYFSFDKKLRYYSDLLLFE